VLVLHMLGAATGFERSLIRERTKAGPASRRSAWTSGSILDGGRAVPLRCASSPRHSGLRASQICPLPNLDRWLLLMGKLRPGLGPT
jgi:hypothetical protein